MDTLCVCGRPLKHTGACRGARRLYRHTSETDALIREAYGKLRKFGNRRALPALRQKLGWPKHVIAKRGRELGLARAKEKPWSAEEKALLEKWAHLSLCRISASSSSKPDSTEPKRHQAQNAPPADHEGHARILLRHQYCFGDGDRRSQGNRLDSPPAGSGRRKRAHSAPRNRAAIAISCTATSCAGFFSTIRTSTSSGRSRNSSSSTFSAAIAYARTTARRLLKGTYRKDQRSGCRVTAKSASVELAVLVLRSRQIPDCRACRRA